MIKMLKKNRDGRYKISLLILTIFLLCIPTYSVAEPVGGYIGSDIAISDEAYDQQNPHIIYLPDKNLWFVVWEDWRNFATTGANIYGQFINGNDGSLCGNEFVITNASGNQTVPWAAYRDKDLLAAPTGNDTVLVVWQDTRANYVYYAAITSFPDTANCSAYIPPAPTGGTQIGFNSIHRYDINTVVTPTPFPNQPIAQGDGTTKSFNGLLYSPVVAGTVTVTATVAGNPVTLTDNGAGLLIGVGGAGTINYTIGVVSVAYTVAPDLGTWITASYTYNVITYTFPEVSIADSLLSRKLPKISYDPVRDRFWVVWIESRDTLNRVSDVCFSLAVFDWEIGDTNFPGYVMLDGATFAPLANAIGVNGADIIRNAQVRTNRRISATIAPLIETYTYEFFTDPNNINISSDITSPEDFIVWEGVRRKGVNTCQCEDKNGNSACDSGEPIKSTFESSFFEEDENGESLAHIYGLFDKEIAQSSINSKRMDPLNTQTAYYPSVGFDPITKRFLVGWEDLRDGANTKIYGQIVYSGGGLYDDNFIISYEDTDGDGENDVNVMNSKQTKPFVSYDGVNQRFFVIWQDGRNSSLSLENLDIYGQKVDAEGSLRGNNFAIFTQPYNQYFPTIAYNDVKNQFLAVWKDARHTDYYTCGATSNLPCGADVYGQRFTLGQPSITLLNMDNTPLSPPLLNEFENPEGSGGVEVGLFATQSFKIRNTGDTTLKIDYIDEYLSCNGYSSTPQDTYTGELMSPFSFDGLPSQMFVRNDGDTLDLVPMAELTLTVRFTPEAGGSYNNCFIIESDGGNPQVNLSGYAMEPNITVTPTSYDFGTISVGTFSEKKFVVRNVGTAMLTISSLNSPQAPFTINSDTCSGENITSGNTCEIVVRFAPTTTGTFNSQFGINSNDPDTPTLNVPLSGIAVVIPGPDITVSPLSINFGDVFVGQNSQQPITISNDGDAALTINSISSPAAPFSIASNNCPLAPSTLAVGSSCQVIVQFAPTSAASTTSSLVISSDDPDEGTVTVDLTGTGILAPADIKFGPKIIDFGSVKVGTTSSVKVIGIINRGGANLTLSITHPTAPFNVTSDDCDDKSLAYNNYCLIRIVFSPTAVATYNPYYLTINSNDPDTPTARVTLKGKGVR